MNCVKSVKIVICGFRGKLWIIVMRVSGATSGNSRPKQQHIGLPLCIDNTHQKKCISRLICRNSQYGVCNCDLYMCLCVDEVSVSMSFVTLRHFWVPVT